MVREHKNWSKFVSIIIVMWTPQIAVEVEGGEGEKKHLSKLSD